MQSLLFTPGQAFLSVNSPAVPWTVVFEDEGIAGYFYACDRSRESQDEAIFDGMLIYNVSALEDPTRERLAAVEWSKDGQQAMLYLDGSAQALFDFARRRGFCRMDFPNFLANEQAVTQGAWDQSTHAWNQTAAERFEAALYA